MAEQIKQILKFQNYTLLHETTSGHSYQMKGVDYNIGINFKCSLKFFWFKVVIVGILCHIQKVILKLRQAIQKIKYSQFSTNRHSCK